MVGSTWLLAPHPGRKISLGIRASELVPPSPFLGGKAAVPVILGVAGACVVRRVAITAARLVLRVMAARCAA